MADNPLVVAPETGSDGPGPMTSGSGDHGWASGIGIAESAMDLQQGLEDGSWVAGGLGSVGLAAEAVSMAVDPIGTLLSYGVGWLMEHVQPLQDALDAIAGDPPAIEAFGKTWGRVSEAVGQAAADYRNAVKADTAAWGGAAGNAYHKYAAEKGEALTSAASLASGIGSVVTIMGEVVAFVREFVRDLIADCISRLITYALEAVCTLGLGTPVIVAQAIALISKYVTRIADILRKLTRTISDVSPKLGKLVEIFGKIMEFLRKAGSNVARGMDKLDISGRVADDVAETFWKKTDDALGTDVVGKHDAKFGNGSGSDVSGADADGPGGDGDPTTTTGRADGSSRGRAGDADSSSTNGDQSGSGTQVSQGSTTSASGGDTSVGDRSTGDTRAGSDAAGTSSSSGSSGSGPTVRSADAAPDSPSPGGADASPSHDTSPGGSSTRPGESGEGSPSPGWNAPAGSAAPSSAASGPSGYDPSPSGTDTSPSSTTSASSSAPPRSPDTGVGRTPSAPSGSARPDQATTSTTSAAGTPSPGGTSGGSPSSGSGSRRAGSGGGWTGTPGSPGAAGRSGSPEDGARRPEAERPAMRGKLPSDTPPRPNAPRPDSPQRPSATGQSPARPDPTRPTSTGPTRPADTPPPQRPTDPSRPDAGPTSPAQPPPAHRAGDELSDSPDAKSHGDVDPAEPGRQRQLDEAEATRESTPAGSSYHSDPNMQDLARRVPDDGVHHTVDAHALPDGRVRIGDTTVSADEFADMLRRDPNWDGRPIRLLSCDAADSGLALRLADELGVPVTAPRGLAWSDTNGTVFSSSAGPDGGPGWPPDGGWDTHHPDGTTTTASDDGFHPPRDGQDSGDRPDDAEARGEGDDSGAERQRREDKLPANRYLYGEDGSQARTRPGQPGGGPLRWDPTADSGNGDWVEPSNSLESTAETPEHLRDDEAYRARIYTSDRKSVPAETEYRVFMRTEMNADGSYVCAATGETIPVRHDGGKPRFYELDENGKRVPATPPEWYSTGQPPPSLPHEKFTLPEPSSAQLGHKPGHEYWRQQRFGLYHETTLGQFDSVSDNPDIYRLETPAANEGHQYESTEPGYGAVPDAFSTMFPGEHFSPIDLAPDESSVTKGSKKLGDPRH